MNPKWVKAQNREAMAECEEHRVICHEHVGGFFIASFCQFFMSPWYWIGIEVPEKCWVLTSLDLVCSHFEVNHKVYDNPCEIKWVWQNEIIVESIVREEGFVCWMLQKPLLFDWKMLLLHHCHLSYIPHAYKRYWMRD